MNGDHLKACSSLTTDGMFQQLDKMLWNHENSYLYEGCMNEQNARDTQFQGFAKALLDEILKAEMGRVKSTYWRGEVEGIIARRAYDLVRHTLEHAEAIAFDRLSIGEHVEQLIPDLTELPKEQKQ